MQAAILNDLTKCIGCEACVLACKEGNGLDKSPRNALSAQTLTVIENRNGLNVRRHCMHCLNPACVSACPVEALQVTECGAVVYDASKCMGCRYCMIACPFGIPTYEWDSVKPRVKKCTMCYFTALQEGTAPACTSVCPTGATLFGEREELIKIAHERLRDHPERYAQTIYGLGQAGGTSVLYLSPIPFEELGIAGPVLERAYPELTWRVLSKIPNVVSVLGVTLFGVWWIIQRRMKLENESDTGKAEA